MNWKYYPDCDICEDIDKYEKEVRDANNRIENAKCTIKRIKKLLKPRIEEMRLRRKLRGREK